MPLQVFPLTGGMNQAVDVRLLPDGVLANAVNCELERIGRIVGRAKYTAQAVTSYDSGNLTAYDLFSVDDRLFAIGDRLGFGFPTDIFERVENGAAAWAPTYRGGTARLPPATRVRDIGRPPDVKGGTDNFSCASVGDFVCLAFNGNADFFVHVFKAPGDQTVVFSDASPNRIDAKVLGLSDRFLILGLNDAGNALGVSRFIPASDESVTSVSNVLYTGLGDIEVYAAAKVAGSDQIVVVANCNGTVIIRRFDSAGVLQVPSGGAYANISADPTHLAIEASSSANQVVVAMVVAGEPRAFTYDLAAGGAALFGPVVVMGSVTASDISLARDDATAVGVFFNVADSDPEDGVQARQYNSAAGSATDLWKVPDAVLTSHVQRFTDGYVFAFRYGTTSSPTNATNMLVYVPDSNTSTSLLLCIAKDFEAAAAPGVQLPDLLQDATSGKWYWCNATMNPDSEAVPVVTEFEMGSTDRRQTCRFGGLTYIGGGMPLVFDTRFPSESGFTERPRIISLTGGAGGDLLPNGSYDYRYHEEQVDALGYYHLSPPSEIETITLESDEDEVTAVASSSHGLRGNRAVSGVGVGIRGVLSRTLATVVTTPAVLEGANVVTPPSDDLDGLLLDIVYEDEGGATFYTVTFTAAAVDADSIASEINAETSSDITATNDGEFITLTSVAEGEDVRIAISVTSTALDVLGFEAHASAQGTTTRSKGENFQRAASGYGDAPGEFITIVDTRKDESDPIVDTDLIRQQVLYSQGIASGAHHAPPPSDCLWAGKERVGFYRQYLRNRWTVSKLIVPSEPAECAAFGFNQFSGQISGDIEAGAFVGGAQVLWSRKQIWLVTGDGPKRNGVGEFTQADCITRSIGLIADGWQSMVQDDDGVWFQGNDGELYRISNGGQLEWLGKPVREYLQTYPVVIGAVYRQAKREVAFAVRTANGSGGGILRRNALVPDQPAWFFDDVGAVDSLAEYQGRLAYVQSGTVYVQDAAPGSGAFPTFYLDSGLFQGFQGLGYGELQEQGVLATFRGRCTLALKMGTDGTTFPDTIASWALTASEYSVGQRVQLLIDTPTAYRNLDAFAMRAEVSDATGSTEGVWLHAFAVKTEKQPDFVRLAPSRRL